MEHVLIVSASEKNCQSLVQFLTSIEVRGTFSLAHSGAAARRTLLDTEPDLILINAPLPDEFGHELAQQAAHDSSAGVLLLVKDEVMENVAEKVEEDGVFVVAKPLNRALFFQALRLIRASHKRISGLATENRKLQQRIEDIRLVDRAKCILIECCSMTEPEAHAYIEKRAMAQRVSKREAALEIVNADNPHAYCEIRKE